MSDLLTNQNVQYVIAIALAALIGWLTKKAIDYKKLMPIIVAICALIFKEEEKQIDNWQKTKEVADVIAKEAPELANKARDRWGSVTNAVDWTYKNIAKPLVGSGIVGWIRKL